MRALYVTVRESENGQMLKRIGLEEDFEVILAVDRFKHTLPVYFQAEDIFLDHRVST